MFTEGDTVDDYAELNDGDLLFNGRRAADGTLNLIRVLSVNRPGADPSAGFLGLYVDHENPTEKRLETDKPFFVWDFELESGRFKRAVQEIAA